MPTPSSALRKAGTYALLLLFLAVCLFGAPVLYHLSEFFHGVGSGTPAQMSGAEVAADVQASGWPTAGTIMGKLFTAAAFFLAFVTLRWLTQQLTHPRPTEWAKKEYSAAFDGLSDSEKFTVYRGVRMDSAIIAAAAMLAAALVQ